MVNRLHSGLESGLLQPQVAPTRSRAIPLSGYIAAVLLWSSSFTVSRLDIADDGAVPFSEESVAHNGPSGISIEGEGGFAYVTNENEGTVTSYDVSEGSLEERDTVTVGSRPLSIALYEVLMGTVPTP